MKLFETIEKNYTKIKKYTEREVSKKNLSNFSWLLLDESDETEVIYIFKNDDSLIISENGFAKRYEYEFVVDSDNLIIKDDKENRILYNCLLIEEKYLILNQSSKSDFMVFANRTKFKDYLKASITKLFKEESQIGFTKSVETIKPQKITKHIVTKPLKDGRKFEIHSSVEKGYALGDKVTIDGVKPKDGKYKLGWFNTVVVENGRIKNF
ncbi:hypothetical protein [Olleya marilimosa]|uniref:Uncharacterized protein n=1 Tax=Olleya marilimosa TaxID=272164 RepID=A0ABR8LX00_9FLAO|nr:hypothetical protein [Olleya marilimosa]MBD3864695.1 hypothetical protein [Olleya marilimosa]